MSVRRALATLLTATAQGGALPGQERARTLAVRSFLAALGQPPQVEDASLPKDTTALQDGGSDRMPTDDTVPLLLQQLMTLSSVSAQAGEQERIPSLASMMRLPEPQARIEPPVISRPSAKAAAPPEQQQKFTLEQQQKFTFINVDSPYCSALNTRDDSGGEDDDEELAATLKPGRMWCKYGQKTLLNGEVELCHGCVYVIMQLCESHLRCCRCAPTSAALCQAALLSSTSL